LNNGLIFQTAFRRENWYANKRREL